MKKSELSLSMIGLFALTGCLANGMNGGAGAAAGGGGSSTGGTVSTGGDGNPTGGGSSNSGGDGSSTGGTQSSGGSGARGGNSSGGSAAGGTGAGGTGGGGSGGGASGGSGSGGDGGGTGGASTGFACPDEPGTAPSGDLTATQIAAANPTDYDFHLLEGPVWIDGSLYYSDFTTSGDFPSQIKKYTPGMSSAEVFIDDSGSNGLAVNAEGNIVAATHDNKEISLYNLEDQARSTIVGMYEGQPFNSPNDLVIGEDGSIYFTDPTFQSGGGSTMATRVYHWNGTVLSVVDDSISNPNGIALSPDGSTLYVSGGSSLRSYPLVDGVPGSGTDIASMNVPDGMTVDCLGNIYAAEHENSRIRVFDPSGTEIATISIGPAEVNGGQQNANATNAAFGGAERTTLYITGTYALWEIDLEVVGFPY